ncbi:hypothetical protein DHEL01_v204877 [Diaporthe helianthi]|uniref:Mid2 domain-containing protein n=1 Tax=Diaporthe helianthi TaxID=158607 RepID=A0A2P5I2I1_DIAHE|nr:hypothetical protein DHEL01_v204877 [Diaporthe helianthi]
MKKPTKNTALAKASALLLLSALPTFASALYIQVSQVSPSELFGRQESTCGESSYAKCNTAGLPDDFCCPADHSCIALAGKTTALCCPSDSDCVGIRPIPCDLSLQDKSLHPENVVMTNALTGTLAKCANLCCPFGYSCDGVNCILDTDQNAKPLTSTGPQSSATAASSAAGSSETVGVSVTSASRPSTSSDASATASATTSAAASGSGSDSATATDSGSQSSSTAAAAEGSGDGDSDPDSSDSSSGPSAGLVAGGVVGGIAAAVFLGMLIWFFIKKEAKRKNEAEKENLPRSSRSSSFGNIINNPMTNSLRAGGCPVISKPIVDGAAMRSDFGRKVSTRAGSFHTNTDSDADYEREFGTMGDRPVSELDMNDLHSVPRSPPTLTDNRAVSSMYAVTDYADESAYQAPLKMPSARQFGGQDNRVSVGAGSRDALGTPVSDYGGQRVKRDPNGAYIDVFANSNVPLTPPQAYTGDRMTRFTDLMDDARDRRR